MKAHSTREAQPNNTARSTTREQSADKNAGRELKPYSDTPVPADFSRMNIHTPDYPCIQPKLTINEPGDKYEQEADTMADKVMHMEMPGKTVSPLPVSTIQRKCAHCEEEEKKKLQRKESGSQTPAINRSLHNYVSGLNNGGQPLSAGVRSFYEPRFGYDFSKVRIHNDTAAAQSAQSINALAYTYGNSIVFNIGKYAPQSSVGKRLLGHELVHVMQQGGHSKRGNDNSNLIQRYFEAKGTAGAAVGKPYRVANDLTMAVKVGYPNHDFYAQSGKAALSNIVLKSVGSGIELVEENSNFHVSQGSNKNTLKKITPKNIRNATSGDSMKISDDCGTSCAVVVGSNTRGALHKDALTGLNLKTAATTPSLMKAEIMLKLLIKWLADSSTTAVTKAKITDVIVKASAKKREITAAETAFAAATTEADKEAKGNIYWAKVDEYGNIMMSFYNTMSESKREEIDKYLGINKFATPGVGQGYTMSSGGTNYPGESTWNFHWGGVVMKSNDQNDTVTLENYAVPGNVENSRWDFAMYGTAAKKGQTFHEQHHDTKQHGDRPTTMTIEKK